VLTGRSTSVNVVDISDGGLLIETRIRLAPGQRETLVLDGYASIKLAGWVERVEITRLFPSVTYRTAIRFGAPIVVADLARRRGPSVDGVSSEIMDRFAGLVRELSGVEAVRVSSSCRAHPGTEPVHFAVPTSQHGEQRMLQVFFCEGAVPTASQFVELRQMAVLAGDLPDFDIASFSSRERRSCEPGPSPVLTSMSASTEDAGPAIVECTDFEPDGLRYLRPCSAR
jgi:hypothetical protein